MRKSFTLIELLVTSAIIMIMLAVTIAYSQKGEGINRINRSIERLSFDIRRIASLSTQTRQLEDKKICGWGIYFNEDIQDRYIIFSDFCEDETIRGDKTYSEEEKYEEIKLSYGTIMQDVDVSMIMYFPPEPRIEIYDILNNLTSSGNISITTEYGNYVKTISINEAGTISIN